MLSRNQDFEVSTSSMSALAALFAPYPSFKVTGTDPCQVGLGFGDAGSET